LQKEISGLKMGFNREGAARDRLTRRFFVVATSAALAPELHTYARLGDAEWMRTFREFIDAFNDFVVGLDHNHLNLVAWERMRTTFHELEAHDRNVK
jgi:hypothetical protein